MPGDKIVLIGMMGAGKTTIGEMAAARLGCEFIDADAVIERDGGMTIPEIFRRHGEAGFRGRELEAIRKIVSSPGMAVVAAGGGAFCQEAVRSHLKRHAVTVFLRVPEDILLARLENGVSHRPMLAGSEWRSRLPELVRDRYPLYGEASHTLDIRDEPPGRTAERLLSLLFPGRRETEAMNA